MEKVKSQVEALGLFLLLSVRSYSYSHPEVPGEELYSFPSSLSLRSRSGAMLYSTVKSQV